MSGGTVAHRHTIAQAQPASVTGSWHSAVCALGERNRNIVR
jgi:hypothetical protein